MSCIVCMGFFHWNYEFNLFKTKISILIVFSVFKEILILRDKKY